MTVISTHHTSLKVYAANTPGVLNASVGFDEATLQPTYELKVGVPGASAGINIAQRLGLNSAIIESRPRAPRHAGARRWTIPRQTACGPARRRNSAPSPESSRAGNRAREAATRRGRKERTAGQSPRNGEETGERSSRLRVSRTRSRQRDSGSRRRAEALERRRAPHRQTTPRIPRAVRLDRGRPLHRRRQR